MQEAGAGSNFVEKAFPLIRALRDLETRINRENVPKPYMHIDHPLNLNIGIIKGGDWASTVPAETEFHARLSYFPGTPFVEVKKKIEQTLIEAAGKDDWLKKIFPRWSFMASGRMVTASAEICPVFKS